MIEYQRVWAEINLDNIACNIKEIKKSVSEKTKIMAVVKADAYGHGAVEITKTLLFNGADSLGVAICDEGVLIRKNNIYVPILILGYTPVPKLADVVLNNLTQTVFSFDMAESLSETAKKLNKTADINIKVDTGMGRLGFLPNSDSVGDIKKISSLPNLNITGIYTHFAVSDNADKTFTYYQFDIFKKFLDELDKNNIKIPCAHVSNSGAIVDIGDFNMNMVRAGIILYGLPPSNEVDFEKYNFKPAMSLKTQVSYIKELDEGVSIGYGRTYFTDKKTKIATIPLGYADGYLRSMSNKGRVLVRGEYAPIIGNICMDQFMIDVTHIKDVMPADEVVLFGKQGDKEITADELAKIQNSINYEIVCNIGKRVPRVYMKNNKLVKTVAFL